jgi:hypothetical protein
VEDEIVPDIRKSKTVKMLQSEDKADLDEDVMEEKEVILNRRLKQVGKSQPGTEGKSTESKKMEIEKMTKKLEEEA